VEKLSEKGVSNAPSVDLAAIWRAKWAEKPLFGGPQGYAACPSDPFRTVSEGEFSEVHSSKQPIGRHAEHSTMVWWCPSGGETRRLGAFVAPTCIKGLRLVTVRIPENSQPIGPRFNRTSPFLRCEKFAAASAPSTPVSRSGRSDRPGLLVHLAAHLRQCREDIGRGQARSMVRRTRAISGKRSSCAPSPLGRR
jgi:hypothetical protein